MSSPQPPDAPQTGSGPEWQPTREPPPTIVSTPAGMFGVIVTNVGKLAGIVGGIHEAAGPARYAAILFWVALFLGAQALEDLLTKLIDRAMGK